MAPHLSNAQLNILCYVAPAFVAFPEGYPCYSKKAWNVCLKNKWIEKAEEDEAKAKLTPLGRKELDKAGILYP